VAAAFKPVLSGLKKVVSAAASLPAKVVSVARDVVVDTVKAATVIYQQAVEAAGSVVQNVSKAIDAVGDFAQAAAPYLKTALKVAADVSGVTDLVSCVTKGDLEACAWTAATIAGYLAGGGGGGAVRAARASRLASKADEATDLIRGGTKLVNEAGDAKMLDNAADGASCMAAANSFTGDTRVRMADGTTKPISEVKIGDKVLATDPTTGRTAAQAVTHVIVGNGQKVLVEVTVDTDGDRGDKTDTVTATAGHPFWVDSERRWVNAGDLAAGQRLQTSGGGSATVLATREWTEQQQVFNLTVDRIHTFFVVAGSTDLLVHNEGRCPKRVVSNWDDIDRQLGVQRAQGQHTRVPTGSPTGFDRGAAPGDMIDRAPDLMTKPMSLTPRSRAKRGIWIAYSYLEPILKKLAGH
jgi:hypothetical protein